MAKMLAEIIRCGEEFLAQRGYAYGSVRAYRAVWRCFSEYCAAEGVSGLDADAAARFKAGLVRGGPGYRRFQARAIDCLFALAETGVFPLARGKIRIPLPDVFAPVYDAWRRALEEDAALAGKTVYRKSHLARKFLHGLAAQGLTDVKALSAGDVSRYLAGLDCTAQTRTGQVFFLREFLRFLVDRVGADPALGGLFPVILVNKDDVLPSVYTAQEVRRAVAAIDPRSRAARRDRAVLLLAAQLGLRVGDIRELTFGQIDWTARIVTLLQSKTGLPVSLPLPEEAFLALVDYWKNERPESDDPHVFVKTRAPHGPYSANNNLHFVIAACFERAGVDTAGKHCGLHSLRHSAAVGMLSANTPYPVVASVLGHASTNTTRRYLRVDVEALRPLCLEVPDAR